MTLVSRTYSAIFSPVLLRKAHTTCNTKTYCARKRTNLDRETTISLAGQEKRIVCLTLEKFDSLNKRAAQLSFLKAYEFPKINETLYVDTRVQERTFSWTFIVNNQTISLMAIVRFAFFDLRKALHRCRDSFDGTNKISQLKCRVLWEARELTKERVSTLRIGEKILVYDSKKSANDLHKTNALLKAEGIKLDSLRIFL